MEHHHDHEEPKPTNKWMSTPIIMAILVIGVIVTFLGMASGTCCGGKCNEKTKTEQHGTGHEEDHGSKHEDEHGTTTEVKDSTAADTTSANHGDDHGDDHGH